MVYMKFNPSYNFKTFHSTEISIIMSGNPIRTVEEELEALHLLPELSAAEEVLRNPVGRLDEVPTSTPGMKFYII